MDTITHADIPAFVHLADETNAAVESFAAKIRPLQRGVPRMETLLQQIEKALGYAKRLAVPGALRGVRIEDQFALLLIGSRLIAKVIPALAMVRHGVAAANVPASKKNAILKTVSRQEARAAEALSPLLEMMEICFNAVHAAPSLDFSDVSPGEMLAMAATACAESLDDPDEDAAWADL